MAEDIELSFEDLTFQEEKRPDVEKDNANKASKSAESEASFEADQEVCVMRACAQTQFCLQEDMPNVVLVSLPYGKCAFGGCHDT